MSDPQTSNEPTVRYLSGRPREAIVVLDEPIGVDGVDYYQFVVRKMTTGDIDAYFDLSEEERKERPLANVEISAAVLSRLDAEDGIKLRALSLDFLPRSLKTIDEPIPEEPASTRSGSADGPVKDSTAVLPGTGSTS